MINIAVLCSGNGSNFQALAESINKGYIKNAKIAVMVTDIPGCFARERAKKLGIDTLIAERKNFKTKKDFEKYIIDELKKKDIGLVVLAGYMRMLGQEFVKEYRNKILNIHPALLPSFKGTQGIKDALDYAVKVTGPTVHFVNAEMDQGPIIIQEAIEIEDTDTEGTLAPRIHEIEHRIYPKAVKLFVDGKLKISGRKVIVKDE
ncbi:MAG: phosphoribosylglycinamide formyltransferase [Candidatus Omnitrophica bacterium CG07_land_8_20_14_0_80_42_15]|uniref:Phosphoribosylglycinamide formyltransferase n=1 Tax=Candidatus Aquitaenariimonas noxiae TaxID=1974741 RepID=A0A2J0KUS2_9BACT|nr:MAG: phosphoribosylglycinamide formyltransferase [Candidatus Omnitrophica bacterium CG07_land_8_20_14_0_80_42_15]